MSAPGAAGPGAPFPQWFVNTTTHTVSKVTSSATKAAAEAVSWPATLIFFTSQAAADAYLKANGGGGDISNSPITGAANTGTDKTAQAVSSANPLSGLAAIGDFFGRLSQANTWIRVAKIVVGGALLVIGLAHMTGASNAVAVAARKAPLPV